MISAKTSKALCACLAAIGLFSVITPATAGIYSIDDFSISRTRAGVTTTIFQDNFNDATAPTAPPYFINGAVGTQSGGRYQFDTATGGIFDAVGEGQVRVSSARFNPVVSNNATNLSSTDIFTVTGVFDLLVPVVAREGYGIRLNDAGISSTTSNLNDRLEILVRRTIDGILAIQFRDSDSFADMTTLIAETDVETNHDQIVLQLAKASAANSITARFAYVDSGVVGAFTDFAGSGTLFDGENFTRAEFRATTPVPIAPTLSLTLLGLMSMFAIRKSKA